MIRSKLYLFNKLFKRTPLNYLMTQRYYIAVPNIPKNVSYHHIPSWTNYSFTGTYDEAMVTAIELFEEKNFFDDSSQIIDNLIHFYKNDSTENDSTEKNFSDSDSDEDDKWYNWDDWSAGEKWENCKDYFKDFFRFTQDEVNSGVALWKDIDYDSKKNRDETRLVVIEVE